MLIKREVSIMKQKIVNVFRTDNPILAMLLLNGGTQVLQGNLAKFPQNPELFEFLDSTGDSVLVEGSPYDSIRA